MSVVPFKSNLLPGEPNPEIVDTLEWLLAQAKAGNLQAIAYVTVRENDTLGTGWDGSAGTRHTLSSAIMMLGHRYAAALLGSDE